MQTMHRQQRERRSPPHLFPIDRNTFVMVFHVSIHLHSLPHQRCYSHADRLFGLGAGSVTGAGSDASMKVWLMVLTTIPYSSTSARRQSKKACAACLDAASDRCRQTRTHTQKHAFRLHACKADKGCDTAVKRLIPNIAGDILDMIVFCGVAGGLHVCKVTLWEHVWSLGGLLEFDLKLVPQRCGELKVAVGLIWVVRVLWQDIHQRQGHLRPVTCEWNFVFAAHSFIEPPGKCQQRNNSLWKAAEMRTGPQWFSQFVLEKVALFPGGIWILMFV